MDDVRALEVPEQHDFRPGSTANIRYYFLVGALVLGALDPFGCRAAPAQTPRLSHSTLFIWNVHVARHDRFRLARTTRICVETTIDPGVIARIQAGGERVDLAAYNANIIDQAWRRFENLRLPAYFQNPERARVNPYISDVADRSCLEQPGNILVRQRIGSDPSGWGYRIAIEASQGRNRYASVIERPGIITAPSQIRVALDSDTIPVTGEPFWDVGHDSYRLGTLLINHIFAGNRL
jgi:hypothetical protein